MKTEEILTDLRENKFINWQGWNKYECKDFVKSNFDCSTYVACQVASKIVNW